MKYKLTGKNQYSKRCKDGSCRNFILYFLNDILILKQKLPFDENYDKGYDRKTAVYDEYLLNGRLYQKRCKHHGCGSESYDERHVSFPLSKKLLSQFNIPKNLVIELEAYEPNNPQQ